MHTDTAPFAIIGSARVVVQARFVQPAVAILGEGCMLAQAVDAKVERGRIIRPRGAIPVRVLLPGTSRPAVGVLIAALQTLGLLFFHALGLGVAEVTDRIAPFLNARGRNAAISILGAAPFDYSRQALVGNA